MKYSFLWHNRETGNLADFFAKNRQNPRIARIFDNFEEIHLEFKKICVFGLGFIGLPTDGFEITRLGASTAHPLV